MNATTPLWVTLLVAALSPVLTLAGVLLTQRAADRRAEREARLRLDHEHEMAVVDRKHALYDELLIKSADLITAAFEQDRDQKQIDYHGLLLRARVLLPQNVYDIAERFRRKTQLLGEAVQAKTEFDELPPRSDVFDVLVEMQESIRAELLRNAAVAADHASTRASR